MKGEAVYLEAKSAWSKTKNRPFPQDMSDDVGSNSDESDYGMTIRVKYWLNTL